MILLTRLNGPVFAVNPDLIERAEATPDTVLTLVDGKKHVVTESLAELVELIRDYRASVVARAQFIDVAASGLISDGSRLAGSHRRDSEHTAQLSAAMNGVHADAAVLPLHRRDS